MINKILLVTTPPHDVESILKSKRSKATALTQKGRQVLPSGLMSIGTYLNSKGYEVVVKDFWDKDWEQIQWELSREDPDIIFSSCLTDSRLSNFRLSSIAKAINPRVVNVIGNAHASAMYEQILRNYEDVDYVVIGEGEVTCYELVRCLDKGGDINRVKGLAFRKGETVYVTERRPMTKNLDEFPFPVDYRFGTGNPLTATINTSRGCPYGCHYCSLTDYWGAWRGKSVKEVLREVEFLVGHGVEYLVFTDDHFTFNKKRAMEIASHFGEYGVKWRMQCRVDRIDKEMLECFKKNGVDIIAFGVESMSQRILDNVHKGVTVGQIEKAFEISHEVGIPEIQANIMIGLPGEDQESINETIHGLKRINPDYIGKFITMVYPGTKLYELMKSKGKIDDSYWLSGNPAPFYTAENDLATLRKWSLQVQIEWYKQRGIVYSIKDIYTLLSDHGAGFASDYIRDGLSRVKLTKFLGKV